MSHVSENSQESGLDGVTEVDDTTPNAVDFILPNAPDDTRKTVVAKRVSSWNRDTPSPPRGRPTSGRPLGTKGVNKARPHTPHPQSWSSYGAVRKKMLDRSLRLGSLREVAEETRVTLPNVPDYSDSEEPVTPRGSVSSVPVKPPRKAADIVIEDLCDDAVHDKTVERSRSRAESRSCKKRKKSTSPVITGCFPRGGRSRSKKRPSSPVVTRTEVEVLQAGWNAGLTEDPSTEVEQSQKNANSLPEGKMLEPKKSRKSTSRSRSRCDKVKDKVKNSEKSEKSEKKVRSLSLGWIRNDLERNTTSRSSSLAHPDEYWNDGIKKEDGTIDEGEDGEANSDQGETNDQLDHQFLQHTMRSPSNRLGVFTSCFGLRRNRRQSSPVNLQNLDRSSSVPRGLTYGMNDNVSNVKADANHKSDECLPTEDRPVSAEKRNTDHVPSEIRECEGTSSGDKAAKTPSETYKYVTSNLNTRVIIVAPAKPRGSLEPTALRDQAFPPLLRRPLRSERPKAAKYPRTPQVLSDYLTTDVAERPPSRREPRNHQQGLCPAPSDSKRCCMEYDRSPYPNYDNTTNVPDSGAGANSANDSTDFKVNTRKGKPCKGVDGFHSVVELCKEPSTKPKSDIIDWKDIVEPEVNVWVNPAPDLDEKPIILPPLQESPSANNVKIELRNMSPLPPRPETYIAAYATVPRPTPPPLSDEPHPIPEQIWLSGNTANPQPMPKPEPRKRSKNRLCCFSINRGPPYAVSSDDNDDGVSAMESEREQSKTRKLVSRKRMDRSSSRKRDASNSNGDGCSRERIRSRRSDKNKADVRPSQTGDGDGSSSRDNAAKSPVDAGCWPFSRKRRAPTLPSSLQQLDSGECNDGQSLDQKMTSTPDATNSTSHHTTSGSGRSSDDDSFGEAMPARNEEERNASPTAVRRDVPDWVASAAFQNTDPQRLETLRRAVRDRNAANNNQHPMEMNERMEVLLTIFSYPKFVPRTAKLNLYTHNDLSGLVDIEADERNLATCSTSHGTKRAEDAKTTKDTDAAMDAIARTSRSPDSPKPEASKRYRSKRPKAAKYPRTPKSFSDYLATDSGKRPPGRRSSRNHREGLSPAPQTSRWRDRDSDDLSSSSSDDSMWAGSFSSCGSFYDSNSDVGMGQWGENHDVVEEDLPCCSTDHMNGIDVWVNPNPDLKQEPILPPPLPTRHEKKNKKEEKDPWEMDSDVEEGGMWGVTCGADLPVDKETMERALEKLSEPLPPRPGTYVAAYATVPRPTPPPLTNEPHPIPEQIWLSDPTVFSSLMDTSQLTKISPRKRCDPIPRPKPVYSPVPEIDDPPMCRPSTPRCVSPTPSNQHSQVDQTKMETGAPKHSAGVADHTVKIFKRSSQVWSLDEESSDDCELPSNVADPNQQQYSSLQSYIQSKKFRLNSPKATTPEPAASTSKGSSRSGSPRLGSPKPKLAITVKGHAGKCVERHIDVPAFTLYSPSPSPPRTPPRISSPTNDSRVPSDQDCPAFLRSYIQDRNGLRPTSPKKPSPEPVVSTSTGITRSGTSRHQEPSQQRLAIAVDDVTGKPVERRV